MNEMLIAINVVSDVLMNNGFKGVIYWVSEKRKYDPEIPIYKKDVEEVRKLEKE